MFIMRLIVYPTILLILLIFLSLQKIHPSSVGIYQEYFFGQNKDPNLIFGQPRAIRSDEWLVSTPKIISQVNSGFPVVNKNIGLGEVMPIQGCLPYKHWRMVFCPNMWGFFFLPLENAYALMWWLPNFFMLVAVYFFILFLSKDIFLSIFSSLIFFFTPFHQWWSYSLAIFLSNGLFFALFFIKSLEKKGFLSWLYLIFSIYFLTAYAFILYPPFQVASFYVFGGLILGYLLLKRIFSKRLILYSLLTILVTFLVIFLFYFEFKQTINIVKETVYPGKRFVANTLGNVTFLINGFYNLQLLDDVKGAGPQANQSEASNFFLLSLFALPAYWWIIINQIIKKKTDYIFLLLNIIFLLLLIWFLFPISSLIAKITLLYLVPQNRAIIGIGLVSYFLMFYFLARIKRSKDSYFNYLVWLCSLLIFFVNLYFGFWLKFNYPAFIQNNLKIILISLISAILIFLLLSKKTKLFLMLLLTFSFASSYRANPLYKGLSSLLDTPLAKEVRKINTDTKGQYGWVVYSSIYLENYLIANGVKSLNGTYFYPQFALWSKFDKDGKYKDIYNRYAHVTLFHDKKKDKFVLYHGDHFGFNLNPCDKELKKMNFRIFLFEKKFDYACLNLFKRVDNLSLFIYKSKNY